LIDFLRKMQSSFQIVALVLSINHHKFSRM
jgi:hypothetical protein